MTDFEPAQFATIVEDIEYIRREWYQHVRGDTLRRGSVTLRLLIVDDLLGQAWRAFGFPKQPKIPAIDFDRHLDLDEMQHPSILAAVAGGGSLDGVEWTLMVMGKGSAPKPDSRDSGDPYRREFHLREFAESTGVFANNVRIRRREIIQYFANVRGGAHLSLPPNRREREERLIERMRPFEGALQVVLGDREVEGLSFELASIGQAIASAPDVQRLLDRIILEAT